MNSACVERLLRISRTVYDLDRSVAFYRDALNFRIVEVVTRVDRAWGRLMGIEGASGQTVIMRLGEQELELVAFNAPGKPYPADSTAADPWFQHIAVIVSDMAAAYAQLGNYPHKPISVEGPQRLPPSNGSVTAYKFRDPDGHPVELLQLSPSIIPNDASLQQPWFRSIDHSAISTSDVEQSIDFYSRLLGMQVASRSLNSGPAQMRLDHEHNVQVAVVALNPKTEVKPHVELLGYERTRGHRISDSVQSNDTVADRLVLQVHKLQRLVVMLESERVAFISPGCVKLCEGLYGAQILDPTGHRLILLEKICCA